MTDIHVAPAREWRQLEIPKDPYENLQWRKELWRLGNRDKRAARMMWQRCANDTLFFFNAFCYLQEPRIGVNEMGITGKVPFITRPRQDVAIEVMNEAWARLDIGFEKSRGEGATWMILLRILQDWLFCSKREFPAFGLVTRNEALVDNPDDPDSLMPKLDWELEQLPSWLKPPEPERNIRRSFSKHTLGNRLNGATITGYPATEDVGSGGRKRVWFMDELAKFPRGADQDAMNSTQPTTECRVFCSTPKGTENVYCQMMQDQTSNLVKIVLDWKDNPARNRGLYKVVRGMIEPVDMEKFGDVPQGYRAGWHELRQRLETKGYILEDSVRSPWYDTESLKAQSTPQTMAQEYDRDYLGSEVQLFGVQFYTKGRSGILGPMGRYIIDYHPHRYTLDYDQTDNGPLKLWLPLQDNTPPKGEYVVACDISNGRGASNSVATICDRKSQSQVGVFVSNTIEPDDFGNLMVALCKWFHDAYLIWESNGPGSAFTSRILTLGYGNVYRRTMILRRLRKKHQEIGFGMKEEYKHSLFRDMAAAVKSGELTIREKDLFEECMYYVIREGKIIYSKAQNKSVQDYDPRGKSHGDRVVSMALAWHAMCDRPMASSKWEQRAHRRETEREGIPSMEQAPVGSMARRLLAHDQRLTRMRGDDGW